MRSTFAVRETASLGIMGAPRVPPLNPSESIVLSEHYRLYSQNTIGISSPIMPRDTVSRTAHVGTVGTNGLKLKPKLIKLIVSFGGIYAIIKVNAFKGRTYILLLDLFFYFRFIIYLPRFLLSSFCFFGGFLAIFILLSSNNNKNNYYFTA